MALIFETENFIVESREEPHISREDGGHIRIIVKDNSITDRTKISPQQAIEFMRLSTIVGEAFELGMKKRGIDIIKINYQDMGNWAFKKGKKPILHMQIYGRVENAKTQIFPEALQLPDRGTGFYDNFNPLDDEDIKEIKKEIERLFVEEKYQDKNWHL